MEYPKVPHSHIVPRAYLEAWARHGEIALHRVGSHDAVFVGLRAAGVRKNFYRRTRLTGEPIYDVEWSLGQAENAALPVLRNLGERWPLKAENKGTLGQFFALQHLRGPAFKEWHQTFLQSKVDALREDPAAHATPPPGCPPRKRSIDTSSISPATLTGLHAC